MVQGVAYLSTRGDVMALEMTIGKLAKVVGVNIETMRCYERLKLLTPTALDRTLLHLVRACRAGQTTDHCPILQSFEGERRGSDGKRNTTR